MSVASTAAVRVERERSKPRSIFGVPARFMGPRLIIYVCTFALVAFGILMIYSASSVTAMADSEVRYNAAYYGIRQLGFAAFGLVLAVFIAIMDYRIWARKLLVPVWILTMVFLALVFVAAFGAGAYGATRWITLPGGITLQPSELAKVTIILAMAGITARFVEEGSISSRAYVLRLLVGVLVPLVAILFQPDKGTTIICVITVFVMAFLAGIPRSWVISALAIAITGILALVFLDAYSRARVAMAWNPWLDEWGDGYQLIQGQYAFSSGGLFGLGIGMSRQKYSYLPMAHNDFIFAIIGEELGLVGTLGVLAVFALLILAAFQVARQAPDLMGRLIAAGGATLIAVQLFINVGGVVGLIPLSGKPVPFISYGGSSVISCLMIVGFIVSVSRHSSLPETVFDETRRDYAVTSGPTQNEREDPGLSLVSEPTPRSARAEQGAATRSPLPTPAPVRLTVLPGGRGQGVTPPDPNDRSPEALRASREFSETHKKGRVSVDAQGRRRIDLGPDAASRLRKK